MQVTKMNLSPEERSVLCSQEFFLVKRSLSQKLDETFAGLQHAWIEDVAAWTLPMEGIDRTRGKIFKGENYLFFPYTIMDFPRHFSREAVFAVRTMCWWGHEFSMTLHLQGVAMAPYVRDFNTRCSRMEKNQLFFCINDHPWEYHFGNENYRPIDSLNDDAINKHLHEKEFLKVAYKIPFSRLDEIEQLGKKVIRSFGDFLR